VYPNDFITRNVSKVGRIKSALFGYEVGLKYLTHNDVEVHFDYLKIGTIDLQAKAFMHADQHA
jgi:hypothetical protein